MAGIGDAMAIPSTLLWWLACTTPDPPPLFASCVDFACRMAQLDEAWGLDSTAALRVIEQTDEIEQIALIDRVLEIDPVQDRAICAGLAPRAQRSCSTQLLRPHLTAPRQQTVRRSQRAMVLTGAGPRPGALPIPASALESWGGLSRQDGPGCSDAASAACDLAGLEAACRSGDPSGGRHYSECLFLAAETSAYAGRPSILALSLCAGSSFSEDCVAHLGVALTPPSPPLSDLTAADLTRASASVAGLSAEVGPELAGLYADRFWSIWTVSVVLDQVAFGGKALVDLPASARPHVLAAGALVVLQGERPERLAEAVEALEAALIAQIQPTAAPPRRARVHAHRSLWRRDRPGEEDLPAVWLYGTSRRAWSADPALDIRIAVLEAAVQVDAPPAAAFFTAVVDDPREARVVRWTAARLAAALYPEALAGRTDDDPLIQGRL